MKSHFSTVQTFRTPIEAELAKGKLEAEGIEAHILDANIVSINWLYSDALGGVRLQVKTIDLERAKIVLERDESAEAEAAQRATILVRGAERADRAAAARLLRAQLEEHHIPLTEPRLLHAIDGLFEEPARGMLFLAFEGEEAIGAAFVSAIWTLEHGGSSAWLEELYVLPEKRDKGTGGLLLDAVILACRERGYAALDLDVEAEHQRAESLYRRAGFRPHTRARWVKEL